MQWIIDELKGSGKYRSRSIFLQLPTYPDLPIAAGDDVEGKKGTSYVTFDDT
jgi:hypothetical protein